MHAEREAAHKQSRAHAAAAEVAMVAAKSRAAGAAVDAKAIKTAATMKVRSIHESIPRPSATIGYTRMQTLPCVCHVAKRFQ